MCPSEEATGISQQRGARRTASSRRSAGSAGADDLFEAMRSIVDGLQATFGRKCEVVLHDYRQREHSVIAVAGDVTDRKVGAAMSEIGLSLLRQGDEAKNKINYMTQLADGRVLKSSTMLIRGGGGVIGALCVNLDVTEMRAAGRLIAELAGDTPRAGNAESDSRTTVFSNDIDAVLDGILSEVEGSLGRPLSALAPAERLEVCRTLDQRGLFQIRRVVPMVAERFGLSRASIYNYIARVRNPAVESTDDDG